MLGIVAVGASQTAVLTGVLYYFGWARTNAFLVYFGLDPTMVGYDTTDYVLRSIGGRSRPAVGVSVIGLAAFAVHRGVVARWPGGGRTAAGGRAGAFWRCWPWRPRCSAHSGGAAGAQRFGSGLGRLFPLGIVVLTVLVGYLDHLRRTYLLPARASAASGPGYRPFAELRQHQAEPPAAGSTASAAPARGLVLLLAGLGLLGAFWAAGLQADAAGRRFAEDLVRALPAPARGRAVHQHGGSSDGPGAQVARSARTVTATGSSTADPHPDPHEQALLLIPVGWQRGPTGLRRRR